MKFAPAEAPPAVGKSAAANHDCISSSSADAPHSDLLGSAIYRLQTQLRGGQRFFEQTDRRLTPYKASRKALAAEAARAAALPSAGRVTEAELQRLPTLLAALTPDAVERQFLAMEAAEGVAKLPVGSFQLSSAKQLEEMHMCGAHRYWISVCRRMQGVA